MAETTFDFSEVPPVAYTPPLRLSPQQEHIVEWVRTGEGNGMIIAVAGSGKTTTLIETLAAMRGRVAFAAFNRRIADEIQEKVQNRRTSAFVKVNTFHGFGFAAWRGRYPKVQIDANKIRELVRTFEVREERVLDGGRKVEYFDHVPDVLHEFVEKLVSLVRQAGIGIVCPINSNAAWNELIEHHGLDDLITGHKPWEEEAAASEVDTQVAIETGKRWALRILRESIRRADEIIDFDDQLYMPLLMNAPIQQFDWVLIDEAQDSNVTRRALAAAMLKPGGRLLAVGDPAQAIYGFTGADSDSLENIEKQFNCTQLNLTVSYRCPRAVVTRAREWVSHIESADDAPMGIAAKMEYEPFQVELVELERMSLETSAILCRKNAPLVSLAFKLIRSRIPCHIQGRDIGASVKSLVAKWKVTKLEDLKTRVNDYKAREVQRFLARGQETRADAVADRCDTVIALIDGLPSGSTVRDLLNLCDTMFADKARAGITLSSIHKAKGLEWETVYWLGANLWQPSPFARKAWQRVQEDNLCYVAATRAKQKLVEVFVPKDEEKS